MKEGYIARKIGLKLKAEQGNWELETLIDQLGKTLTTTDELREGVPRLKALVMRDAGDPMNILGDIEKIMNDGSLDDMRKNFEIHKQIYRLRQYLQSQGVVRSFDAKDNANAKHFDVEVIHKWEDMGVVFNVGDVIPVKELATSSDFYYSGQYNIPKDHCRVIE